MATRTEIRQYGYIISDADFHLVGYIFSLDGLYDRTLYGPYTVLVHTRNGRVVQVNAATPSSGIAWLQPKSLAEPRSSQIELSSLMAPIRSLVPDQLEPLLNCHIWLRVVNG